MATGITRDLFSGVAATEGSTDRNYTAGDKVEARPTQGSYGDIHAAINTIENAPYAVDTAVVHLTGRGPSGYQAVLNTAGLGNALRARQGLDGLADNGSRGNGLPVGDHVQRYSQRHRWWIRGPGSGGERFGAGRQWIGSDGDHGLANRSRSGGCAERIERIVDCGDRGDRFPSPYHLQRHSQRRWWSLSSRGSRGNGLPVGDHVQRYSQRHRWWIPWPRQWRGAIIWGRDGSGSALTGITASQIAAVPAGVLKGWTDR